MKKIKCPFCGKELVVLNDVDVGIFYKYRYEFWCDECEIEITIKTDKEI